MFFGPVEGSIVWRSEPDSLRWAAATAEDWAAQFEAGYDPRTYAKKYGAMTGASLGAEFRAFGKYLRECADTIEGTKP